MPEPPDPLHRVVVEAAAKSLSDGAERSVDHVLLNRTGSGIEGDYSGGVRTAFGVLTSHLTGIN
jgi:hypothetical protein